VAPRHPTCGIMAKTRGVSAAAAAAAAAAAIAGDPNTGPTVLAHVIEQVLNQPSDGTLAQAITRAGITEIYDLTALNQAERDSLTFLDKNTLVTPLPLAIRNLLKAIRIYGPYCLAQGKPITKWTEVTKIEFDKFRCSMEYYNATEFNVQVPTAPRLDPLHDFRKGIRRDASIYVVLKDNKQWDSWHRSTMAQARAQDVVDVLDPDYVPPPGQESLFEAKQDYLYATFERILQTDKGKSLVRAYEKNSDAQQIFKELCEDALRSTRSSIDSSLILSYITSVRVGDGQWNGTAHGFILHWQEQVRLYESLVDASAHFNNGQKLHMLQNAVHPLQELRQVKNQADQLQAYHGRPMPYETYCRLLLSAGSNYDAQYAPKGRPIQSSTRAIKREVYAHGTQETEEDYHDPGMYNLDSSAATLQANIHDQVKTATRPPQLTGQQWKSLHPDARVTWDQLPDEAKGIILGMRKPSNRRSANLHDISAYDFIQANLHELQLDDSNDTGNFLTDESVPGGRSPMGDDTGNELLAFLSKQQAPNHPGHLVNVLSTSASKSSQGSKYLPRARARTPSPTKDNEIVVNSKKYRQVNVLIINYSVSIHKSSQVGSLVDRGANGGIAGGDVRVIEKTERTVDVRGIDNHQIVGIPIVTAGAVVTTQRGPVIVILHQYAYTGQGRTIHSSAQLEWFYNDVNDKSTRVSGGLQRILTNDGYLIPISMKDGLPYVNLRPYTDSEWDSLPHVVLTGDTDWDPSVLDCDYEDNDTWHDALSEPILPLPDPRFDEFGDYRKRILVQEHFHDANDWACTSDIASECATFHRTCASTAADACAQFHTCTVHTRDVSLIDHLEINTKSVGSDPFRVFPLTRPLAVMWHWLIILK